MDDDKSRAFGAAVARASPLLGLYICTSYRTSSSSRHSELPRKEKLPQSELDLWGEKKTKGKLYLQLHCPSFTVVYSFAAEEKENATTRYHILLPNVDEVGLTETSFPPPVSSLRGNIREKVY
jgi:hypothetical protein